MRAFDRGNNALKPTKQFKRCDALIVGYRFVFCTTYLVQMRVLRAYAWIIKPRRNAVYGLDHAEFILQYDRFHAVDDARASVSNSRCMIRGMCAQAARFDANKLHARIIHERAKNSYRIASAAHAG